MMTKHVVAALSDFPSGTRKLVHVSGRAIVVFNVRGEFFALNNRCPHRGGDLSRGLQTGLVESKAPGQYKYSRRGEMIKCPWHGWEFDVRTGQSWCDPSRVRVRQYLVSVEPGEGLVAGPYVAETVPVTVENDYVVIEA